MPPPQNREALHQILRDAKRRYLLDSEALAMIEGVFEVAELRVRDIMIPRASMVVLRRDDSLEVLLKQVVESAHSRFPVIGDDKGEVVGIVLAKDLLAYCSQHPSRRWAIRDVLRAAVFVPESKRLNTLLKEFRASRNHMAIVVDEYGNAAGLVTIEDVLEQIVGEIEDEFDTAVDEGDIFALVDRSYRVSGDTTLERVEDAFDVKLVGRDPDDHFDTIGGLIAHEMGHVPKRGERHTLAGLDFVVLHTKGGAVKWFKVSPVSDADA